VAFDARNHGESPHSHEFTYRIMLQDTLALAQQLRINKFVLMGHSMGGRTTAMAALKCPEKLEAAVLVDISPLNVGGDFDEMKSYLQTMRSINFSSSSTLSEGRKMADEKLKSTVKSPQVRSFLLMNLSQGPTGLRWKPNVDVLLENLSQIKEFPPFLLNLTSNLPILLIRGGKSAYVPVSDFEGIKKMFPNVEFATIPNAGHWTQADSPQLFIQTLVTFLNKLN